MFAPVYLDHNATTPLHGAVWEAMLPFLREQFGNASSRHEYGRAARRAVDVARQQVAAAVGAHPTEVVFTSGGSETNNLFLKGMAEFLPPGQIAISAIEHPCVLKPARQLRRRGWAVTELPVTSAGLVSVDALSSLAQRGSLLVSIMYANNETGVVQDMEGLAQVVRDRCPGAWMHSDGVQALGKIPVDFRALNRAGVHALTLSSHKIRGPKGAAALIADKRLDLAPLIAGGGQERGLRSGTENVAAIVGFGAACELAVAGLAARRERLDALRGRLEAGVLALGGSVFGRGAPRLPNTSYFAFPGIDGETLVGRLDRAGYAVASGAACSSANPEPSHVLAAMGVAPDFARGAVRVSLGEDNQSAEVDGFLQALGETLRALRELTAMAATD